MLRGARAPDHFYHPRQRHFPLQYSMRRLSKFGVQGSEAPERWGHWAYPNMYMCNPVCWEKVCFIWVTAQQCALMCRLPVQIREPTSNLCK